MRLMRLLAGTGLLFALGLGTHVLAQDAPPPPPAEEPAGTEAPAAPAEEPEEQKEKAPFGLYVEAAVGQASADDLLTGIQTYTTATTDTVLRLEDQQYVRAAVGWQLPHGKGDFRLRFDGFSEDGYRLSSKAYLAEINPSSERQVTGNLLWWTLESESGNTTAVRTPPEWDLSDDANDDGKVDPDEVRYPGADRTVSTLSAKDLKNRAQVIDALYGRTFGKRRFTGRWWGGLRYFNYDGNIQGTAWLGTDNAAGFTENALLPLMNFKQETSGFGPTGALEADFNFFEDRFTAYLSGQFAFMVTSVEMDSGLFSTLVEEAPVVLSAPARLQESRDKSSWQLTVEAGLRLRLKSGIQFEAAYYRMGFLDVILVPTQIQIPSKPEEIPQRTAALYETQDYIMEGWRFGVGFQF
jgi:hypothetical protein